MKDELGGQIMKEFVGLRAKPCSYLKENNDENKTGKGTKIVQKDYIMKLMGNNEINNE